MCGIVALVAFDTERSREATVTRMVTALRHRGPDDQGVHKFGRCILGSARLSIVDVAGGRQPILSANGQTGVTFNGAIYGFRELRRTLSEYPFKTDTDTEVILALYARYGDHFLSHLPGMFGFALWDERLQTLTCARDRFGEKPLYYAYGSGGEFLVASEIKGLLASGLIEPVLSRRAISHYAQRLHVHPTHTIYDNVHVLPPAHALRFKDRRIEVFRYWKPPDARERAHVPDAVERFRELLDGAIKKQLVSDVPVGVFLSGGVDSSTVTAIASRHHQGVKSFSFGFKEGIDSELPYARGIAARYHTSHFEMTDEPADIPALLLHMQDVYDEPFADSSNIPTFLLCRFARQQVTVALGGDGADELLGGYLHWSRSFFADASRPPSDSAIVRAILAVKRLARRLGGEGQTSAGSPLAHRYAQEFRVCFTPEERKQIGLTDEAEGLVDFSRYQTGGVDDLLRFDLDLYLPGDILVKTDRASMANSLELRAPFLDIDVASFCLSLPDDLKVDSEREKLVLRRAYGDSWTPEIRNRPKQGFGGPMAEWLSCAGLSELKRDTLGDRTHPVFGILDFEGVQAFVERNDQRTWSLLVLALWLAKHPCHLPTN